MKRDKYIFFFLLVCSYVNLTTFSWLLLKFFLYVYSFSWILHGKKKYQIFFLTKKSIRFLIVKMLYSLIKDF